MLLFTHQHILDKLAENVYRIFKETLIYYHSEKITRTDLENKFISKFKQFVESC
jgi:hypothetical protein